MLPMHKLIYQPGRVWGRAGLALLLLGCALLNSACSDAFIPPPEDLPPGQTAPEPEAVPLGPPPDL